MTCGSAACWCPFRHQSCHHPDGHCFNDLQDMLVVFPIPLLASSSSISYTISCQKPKCRVPLPHRWQTHFRRDTPCTAQHVVSKAATALLQCTVWLQSYSRYLHVYSWIRGTSVATCNASWCISHKGRKSLSFSQHLSLFLAPQVTG